jgi:hypothetical protein
LWAEARVLLSPLRGEGRACGAASASQMREGVGWRRIERDGFVPRTARRCPPLPVAPQARLDLSLEGER